MIPSKTTRATLACLQALLLAALAGCAQWSGGAHRIEASGIQPAPWTGLEARAARDDFRFVVVSDRTGGARPGVFEAAIGKINLLRPAFVVSVGDLIEGYTEDPAQLDAEWRELQGLVARLDAPFFYTAGNHDYSNASMSQEWRDRFGPSYYHFRYEDVLFLVLNSEIIRSVAKPDEPVPGPDARDAQLAFAQAALAANRDARWTFVILHQPLWEGREVHPDWLAIEEWLGDRPYTVLSGHIHRYTKQMRRDRRYITLGTTGGFSLLRGIDHGEFDHVTLVSMSEAGPVIANLMLDGIHDEDVRLVSTRNRLTKLERALSSEPFVGEGAVFRGGIARFTIANDGPSPIRVEAALRASRDLVPGADSLSREIAPGASETLDIEVKARRPVPFEALAPATVSWTLRTPKADGAALEVESESWLLPERRFRVPPVSRAVVTDGRLDEWPGLPFVVDAQPAAPDAPAGTSIRFGIARDDDHLHLAIDVADPTPFFDSERTARDQDGVTVILDARPAPERDENASFFQSARSGAAARMLFAWLVAGDFREDPLLSESVPPLPDGVRSAVQRTGRGYTAELAIPHAILDERQGGGWRALRLELSVNDYATDGIHHVTHWWRPSRFGMSSATPIPGSGTFER